MTPRRRLREAIDGAAETLARAGIDSARTDAELLAAHVAGVDRGRLTFIDDPADGFYPRYRATVSRRAERVPLQHITGNAAFGPVDLAVGPGVFIPRPETEAMLEWALAQSLCNAPVIVDVCTGSGALAVALAAAYPHAQVIAIDDDPDALRYARRNVEGRAVRIVEADVAAAVLLPEIDGTVDLVVANPPYIPEGADLEPEVAEHDPHHALFGGADGMALIGPIVTHAARWLSPGGLLAVEHDDTTSSTTVELIRATEQFEAVTPHPDLTGGFRFVTARRSGEGSGEGWKP
jgi:release factor glutamine methyltransferase